MAATKQGGLQTVPKKGYKEEGRTYQEATSEGSSPLPGIPHSQSRTIPTVEGKPPVQSSTVEEITSCQHMDMSSTQDVVNSQQQFDTTSPTPSTTAQPMVEGHSPDHLLRMVASAPVATTSRAADVSQLSVPSQASSADSTAVGEIPRQRCIRKGCPNLAIESRDWDREYCSSECVASYCKQVFTSWVAQRQLSK